MGTQNRQAVTLGHWFGVDCVLFESATPKDVLAPEIYKKYCKTKGAFLLNLYEMYSQLNYNPNLKISNLREMPELFSNLANKSLEKAGRILREDSVKKLVRKEIAEMNLLEGSDHMAKYVVKRRRNAVAIDDLTMTKALKENSINANDFHNKVLVDAHKTLRDALIDLSLS
jgi:hypothetical protein